MNEDLSDADAKNNADAISYAMPDSNIIESLKSRNQNIITVINQQKESIDLMIHTITDDMNAANRYNYVCREFNTIVLEIHNFTTELNILNNPIEYYINKSNSIRQRFYNILEESQELFEDNNTDRNDELSETPPMPERESVLSNPVYVDEQSNVVGLHGIHEYKDIIPCPKPTGRDVEAEPIILKCVVCHTNQSSTVIFPCMHIAMCDVCSSHLIKVSNVCPMCRTGIFHISRIYLASEKYVTPVVKESTSIRAICPTASSSMVTRSKKRKL